MLHMHFPHPHRNADWSSLVRHYEKYVTPSSHVLEIGASTQARTQELARKCGSLTGVEISPERIPEPSGNIVYKAANWENLSSAIEEDSVDIAVASHVIEHVPNDLLALNELYKVLRPGGVALLSTPNRKRLTRALIEVFTGPRQFPHWEHVREYIESDIHDLLKRSDFTSWQVNAVVFGLHGGRFFIYSDKVPKRLRAYANYWEIILFKESA